MTGKENEQLSLRLDRLGMPIRGERLARAAEIVRAHGADAGAISDMTLLSICVEAYRHTEKETLQIV